MRTTLLLIAATLAFAADINPISKLDQEILKRIQAQQQLLQQQQQTLQQQQQALNTQAEQIRKEQMEVLTRVCKERKIAVDACSIDIASGLVSEIEAPAPATAPATPKP